MQEREVSLMSSACMSNVCICLCLCMSDLHVSTREVRKLQMIHTSASFSRKVACADRTEGGDQKAKSDGADCMNKLHVQIT
jgi:hypothetical protein